MGEKSCGDCIHCEVCALRISSMMSDAELKDFCSHFVDREDEAEEKKEDPEAFEEQASAWVEVYHFCQKLGMWARGSKKSGKEAVLDFIAELWNAKALSDRKQEDAEKWRKKLKEPVIYMCGRVPCFSTVCTYDLACHYKVPRSVAMKEPDSQSPGGQECSTTL